MDLSCLVFCCAFVFLLGGGVFKDLEEFGMCEKPKSKLGKSCVPLPDIYVRAKGPFLFFDDSSFHLSLVSVFFFVPFENTGFSLYG